MTELFRPPECIPYRAIIRWCWSSPPSFAVKRLPARVVHHFRCIVCFHFVNFFSLTPNLTKKVDETSIQKVDETSVPRPGPWLLSGVWRRPYTGVSGRPVFACLQPVRRREFSWVYTGVVLASNVANRVYRFYTFRFSTTATEKIVLLYEQITYASALS